MKKLLAVILALAMALIMGQAALANEFADLLPAVRTQGTDYTGKTIILHSNDVHGVLDGYACMTGLKNQFLGWGASQVILADDGDFCQGSIYVSTTYGATAVEMMNVAGYDVVTLGNHEFDYSYPQLKETLKDAAFTTICCNIFMDGTNEPILPPSTVIETESGLKIGFVGIETPETASKVNPKMITDIHFSTFDDLYTSVQTAVDAIRDDCDLVVALAHLGVDDESAPNGYRSIDLLQKVNGIDFTIDGHSHTVMTYGLEGQAIQSTGAFFAYVGVVVIDDASKTVEDHFLLDTSKLPKDKDVADRAKEIMDAIDEAYTTPFASSEVLLNGDRDPGNRTEETNMGDLITDAMVWSVVKDGGIEQVEPNQVVGIVNGGSIRAPILPGDVSMKDINNVLPFGNTVSVIYVKGHELLEALEASTFSTPGSVGGFPQTSGIEWTLDVSVPFDQGELYTLNGKETTFYAPEVIQRVTITAINGEPFDPEATYAVVTNDFCAAGGDTYNVFHRAYDDGAGFDTGIKLDEAVTDYIYHVLNDVITAEKYGQPRGSLTIVGAPVEEAVAPAA